MAIRIQQLLLSALATAVSFTATAQSDDNHKDNGSVVITPIVVIEPERAQRESYEANIDSEFFEMGFYTGILSIEDYGSSTVTGLKVSFHATEDFFLQANAASAKAGLTSNESAGGSLPAFNDRSYDYYNLLVGYNIFPGETFVTQDLTFNSAFYLIAGIGNTTIAKDEHFTTTFGSGYRIILNDWLTANMDFRDHSFKHSLINAVTKRTHNLEFSTGLTAFF
jgi:outer membrane beta-barrel protein